MSYTVLSQNHMVQRALSAKELFGNCVSGLDKRAWEEFFKRYNRTITYFVRRFGGEDESDEIVQEVYVKLCSDSGKALRCFLGSVMGSDFAYLRTLIRHVVADWYRLKRRRDCAETLLTGGAGKGIASEPARSLERRILARQIRARVQTVAGERDRLIFCLYYQAGLSAHVIARHPSVQLRPKGVESVLFRLTKEIRDHVNS